MPQLTTLIPSFAAPVTDRVWLLTSSPRLKPGDSSHPDDGRGSGL